MTITRTHYRKAVYAALLLSVVGLFVVSTAIMGAPDTAQGALLWSRQILTGYAIMILVIEIIGLPLRSKLARYWLAAPFGLGLFLVGVTAGSATSMLFYRELAPFDFIIKPLYWMGIYGFIPALIIGCIFCALLRHKAESTTDSTP